MNQRPIPKWLLFVTKLQYLLSKTWFRLIIISFIGSILLSGMLFMNQRDRDHIQSRSMAPDLREIGLALDQYLQNNNDIYPPNLEILRELKLLDRSIDITSYKFNVAGVSKKSLKPDDFILLEPEITYHDDRLRFALRVDGRVTYCARTDQE